MIQSIYAKNCFKCIPRKTMQLPLRRVHLIKILSFSVVEYEKNEYVYLYENLLENCEITCILLVQRISAVRV